MFKFCDTLHTNTKIPSSFQRRGFAETRQRPPAWRDWSSRPAGWGTASPPSGATAALLPSGTGRNLGSAQRHPTVQTHINMRKCVLVINIGTKVEVRWQPVKRFRIFVKEINWLLSAPFKSQMKLIDLLSNNETRFIQIDHLRAWREIKAHFRFCWETQAEDAVSIWAVSTRKQTFLML